MKILLAVDGTACSDAAIEEIGRRPPRIIGKSIECL